MFDPVPVNQWMGWGLDRAAGQGQTGRNSGGWRIGVWPILKVLAPPVPKKASALVGKTQAVKTQLARSRPFFEETPLLPLLAGHPFPISFTLLDQPPRGQSVVRVMDNLRRIGSHCGEN